MTTTQINAATPSSEVIYTNTALGATKDAVKASSAVVYLVTVDNTLNGAASYVKLWNALSGSVTVGSTAPDEIIMVPANSSTSRPYFTGSAGGVTYGTGLTVACVTAGGTAGVTAPTSNVPVSIVYV